MKPHSAAAEFDELFSFWNYFLFWRPFVASVTSETVVLSWFLDFLDFCDDIAMIHFVLPRDGPPQILLGASVVNAWKGYLHPELTGMG